ncbi:MAG: hypothetical protein HFE63_01810 [Clostridiales bacterium]|nr:hypothetical protein [Clostridiales bacterium]
MIITIDGGTTNTRFTLIESGKIYDRLKLQVGVRDTAISGSSALSSAVRDGISELLKRNDLCERDISSIALSGMICSESGLYNSVHVITPTGIDELRQHSVRVMMPDITQIPMIFIPGVKTFDSPSISELSGLDIMRGEETEIIGILSSIHPPERHITALMPGSHMKIVSLENRQITSFRTSLSGELIRAAAENTILNRSLSGVYPHIADEEYLRRGYRYAKLHGINEALFKVRVQANFIDGVTSEQLYAFLMGAILHDDIRSTIETGGDIIIAGSNPFRSALAVLLGDEGQNVTVLPEKLAEECSAIGSELIVSELM